MRSRNEINVNKIYVVYDITEGKQVKLSSGEVLWKKV